MRVLFPYALASVAQVAKTFSSMRNFVSATFNASVMLPTPANLGRVMVSVIGLIGEFKVFYSVVALVAILVVNNLIAPQEPAKMFLHDDAVLKPGRFADVGISGSWVDVSARLKRWVVASDLVFRFPKTVTNWVAKVLDVPHCAVKLAQKLLLTPSTVNRDKSDAAEAETLFATESSERLAWIDSFCASATTPFAIKSPPRQVCFHDLQFIEFHTSWQGGGLLR
jgi:hypothetical protein